MPDEAILRIILQSGEGLADSPLAGWMNPLSQEGGSAPSFPDWMNPIVRHEDPLTRPVRSGEFDLHADQPDVTAAAMKRVEKDIERAKLEREYASLREIYIPFDPVEKARKRLKADQEREAIDREYAKIAPADVIPVFDPVAEAQKKREKERQKAQVDAAYKDQYGDDTKKTDLDHLIKAIDPMRGMLGGIFGPVAGGLMDVMKGARQAEIDAAKDRKQKDLLDEAAARTHKERSDDLTPAQQEELSRMLDNLEKIPVEDIPPDERKEIHDILGQLGERLENQQAPVLEEVGATGGAGGGMKGMAGAAGMVGLIVAAAQEIDRAVRGAIKSTIGTVGGIAAGIASPSADPAVPVANLGNAASAAGEKLGGFGHGLTIAGESLKALSSVMQALDQTAGRYAEFSPEIASAQATAEIRQAMGDFRRSREISEEMSKYVIAQSDLQQKFEDVKVKLLNQMLPLITGAVTTIEQIMNAGENTAKAISILATPLNKMVQLIAEKIGMDKDDQPDVNDPTDLIHNPRFNETPDVGGFAPNR